MDFSFDTESGHLRELFGTLKYVQNCWQKKITNPKFWGSFQDLVFEIEIANYLKKFRLFLYHFSTL